MTNVKNETKNEKDQKQLKENEIPQLNQIKRKTNHFNNVESEDYFMLNVKSENTTFRNKIVSPQSNAKRTKISHLIPMLWGRIKIGLGRNSNALIKILLDSGASSSIVDYNVVKKL